MDEPLANIDVTLKATILRHLQSLREQYRFTMLYVTHDHREAMQTGDSISVMNAGKIEVSGTVQQMRESSNEFVKSFIHLLNRRDHENHFNIKSHHMLRNRCRLRSFRP